MAAAGRPNQLFRNLNAKIASIPMVLTALLVFAGGTIWTVVYSFTDSRLLPRLNFVGLDQYVRLWGSANNRWHISIDNILIYGVCSLVLSLCIGFLLAALLDQKIRFENTFRTIFLYPFALSFVVTGLVWQWILNPEFGIQAVVRGMGWESFSFRWIKEGKMAIYTIVIAAVWQSSGFVMAMFLAGLRGVDNEVIKAAQIDGASTAMIYRRIIIPLMRPVFLSAFVVLAHLAIKSYDLVVAMTDGGPGTATWVPALFMQKFTFGRNEMAMGASSAIIMMMMIFSIIVPYLYSELRGGRRS